MQLYSDLEYQSINCLHSRCDALSLLDEKLGASLSIEQNPEIQVIREAIAQLKSEN